MTNKLAVLLKSQFSMERKLGKGSTISMLKFVSPSGIRAMIEIEIPEAIAKEKLKAIY